LLDYPVSDNLNQDQHSFWELALCVAESFPIPFSKERIALLAASPDALRLDVQAPTDMVPPPLHVHLHAAESFKVVEGEATVTVGQHAQTLRVGQCVTVAPGTSHTWRNSGDGVLRIEAEFRPAGGMQSFFETFCGLATEGRCNQRGQPSLLQVAVAADRWDSYLAGPPIVMQRVLFGILRPIAWLRGYRPSYTRFEHTLERTDVEPT
jgi:mannose-6-phosphate isomerase-like protein (cupin superfamily)